MEIRTLFIIFKGLYNEYEKYVVKEIKKHSNKVTTFDEYIYGVLDISEDFDDMLMRCIDVNISRGLLFTSKTHCNIIIDGDLISEYMCSTSEDRQVRSEFLAFFNAMVIIKYYGIDNCKIESVEKYMNPNGLCDTKINCKIY